MGNRVLTMALVLSLLTGMVALASPGPGATQSDRCPPLSPPTGPTITISSEPELRNQAYNAAAGTTIMIEAGVYHMENIIHVVNDGITIRGATGQREGVILDLGGMGTGHMHGFLIDADDITIADLTIRSVGNHGVSVQGKDRPILYNLHILDTGQQIVKINPGSDWSEDGLLACSRLEYTSSAPTDYTNGISAHRTRNWVIRDNEWYRIRGNEGYTGPTILFWNESSDTVVERNLLIDCYRGIAFGNPGESGVNHTGGFVRNNFIYSSLEHDVAIEMTRAQGWLVAHNTAMLLNPSPGLTWGMEARYPESQGTFAYNLTNMNILHDRDGAQGTLVGNVTNAGVDWFVDATSGDLHLTSTASGAIDQAATLANVSDDYDGDERPIGAAPDVGGDEYGTPPPAAVTDLRVSQAVTDTGTLSGTLRWTAPADGITYTLRYSGTLISDTNWDSAVAIAVPFTASAPGSTEWLTTSVPYTGGSACFALKSQNGAGDWSALSNNGFWPHLDVYLPLVLRGYGP